MVKVYKNNKRSTGSQVEKPVLSLNGNSINVGGYQRYTITRTSIKPVSYSSKFEFIKKFLAGELQHCQNITDIGCSNGIVCFMAQQLGYQKIQALDHDKECIKLIGDIKSYLDIKGIEPKEYSFGNEIEPSDIVIMCALIHWVYSCTALYGTFDDIFKYLQKIVGKVLLIEWVDPADPAIRYFKHIFFNKEIIKEEYTEANFETSLKSHFSHVEKVFNVTKTRKLYIARV